MGKLNSSGSVFAVNLKYKTLITDTDCISILKRRNMYDTFEYSLKFIDKTIYNIVFTKALTHMCRNIRTEYNIVLSTEEGATVIYLNFIKESHIFSVPFIPESWINEFMEQKLDAIPF